MELIIVESPHKAKTIEKFLGSKYKVDASKGHVRDLPVNRLGVNLSKNFEPFYVENPDKKDDIKRLKEKAQKADKVYLATDPDREGEAISWHLAEVLKLEKGKYSRIVFNEISEKAVKGALANPRDIDQSLVDAQQARRILDRIVGYSISPVATTRLGEKNLSAGRVQSVALRMVVEREREIQGFKPQEYWNLKALLETTKGGTFKALLQEKNGKKYKPSSSEEATAVEQQLKNGEFIVKTLKKSVVKTHAPAPFITSTLQQDGSNKLNITAPMVMQIAQRLYEGVETPNGHLALITYMRTDSVRVSKEAQDSARAFIKQNYGDEYCPDKPNVYRSKKDAQDAHEAIRPIDVTKTPDSLKGVLDKNQYRLYKIIYERFIASQMSEAKYNAVNVEVENSGYTLKASGKTLVFKGFTAVYDEYQTKNEDDDDTSVLIPELSEGERLGLANLTKEQKFTKPPLRYTEATLIKAMEDKGIGRPSTYATIMAKLSDKKREYVYKDGKYLLPNEISFNLVDFLVKYFPDIMTISFTARMENALDELSEGGKDWHKLIADFYAPFERQLQKSKITDVICEKCGSPMTINSGKFGKFDDYYACTNYPACKNIKSVNEKAQIPTDKICEKCGSIMLEKEGKFGKFLACSNYPACKNTKSLNEKKSGKLCEKCGEEMIEKQGQFGKYLYCNACRHTVSLAEMAGVCPVCGKPTRKMMSKTGKTFYGCSQHPNCNFMSWDLPTGKKCETCGAFTVLIDGVEKCSNRKCATNNTDKDKK